MFLIAHNPFIPHSLYCSSTLSCNVKDTVLIKDPLRELLYATVMGSIDAIPDTYEDSIRTVVRKTTIEDDNIYNEGRLRADDAMAFCKAEIRAQMLPMKLVAVEMLFNMSKLIFYFTAPERVDFRNLVKSLVERYRERIELKQIGVRNEVQLLGGVGSCGRKCCCTTFMKSVIPVSVKMAKQHSSALNPQKMSGVCGRLSCCLSYENDR